MKEKRDISMCAQFSFSKNFLSFLVTVVSLVGNGRSAENRPNIILILADDAGWNDFSFHGSAQIPTPNIDALAFSGAVLNSYYGSPLCTPSRGAILTGKHPIHLGLQHFVILADTDDGLPLSEKLLPEYLKELGYSTHLVGKWHLGHSRQVFSPTFRGFDTHFGYWLGDQDYYNHTCIESGHTGFDFRNGMDVNQQAVGLYNTNLFTAEAVRLIHQHPTDEPMFLMISHAAPHIGSEIDPLQAPQENIDKFSDSIEDENRRVYAAMVDKLDESVGSVMAELSSRGMLNNSIVIFASDNGGAPEGKCLGYGLNYGSNWPLRGVKNTLWEGGTRLAACVWSSTITNRVSKDLMHASDWLPTLYEAAGGNITDLGDIDGVSLWETLTNSVPSPRHELLYNIDDIYNNSAVRYESWKLIQGNTSSSDFGGGRWDDWYGHYMSNKTVADLIPDILESDVAEAMRNIGLSLDPETIQVLQNDAKIECTQNRTHSQTVCNPYESPCLFNILEDPCEQNNLVNENQEIVREMLELITSYNDTAREIIDLTSHPEAAPHFWNNTWTNWKDFV